MSENNVNGITSADVATTTGIVGATVAIGQYIINDYVITIAEAEGDYGYTMTITRGTDTQTATLYGLTPEQYASMLGYLEQAQAAAQSAGESAQAAGQSAYSAGVDASSAANARNAARSSAIGASSSASAAASARDDAVTARTDAITAKNAAEAAATRAETAAGQITGMTAEAETLTPGSPATASFLDGVLSLGIPAGANGADGNGIVSIVKTGTSGNVDTYTIIYTNDTTSNFTVTNGAVTSVAGKTGAVTLDAGDVAFDDQQAYNDGTVGAGLTNLKSQMSEDEEYYGRGLIPLEHGNFSGSNIASNTTNVKCARSKLLTNFGNKIISVKTGYKAVLYYGTDATSTSYKNISADYPYTLNGIYAVSRIRVQNTSETDISGVDLTGIVKFESTNSVWLSTGMIQNVLQMNPSSFDYVKDSRFIKPIYSIGDINTSTGIDQVSVNSSKRIRTDYIFIGNLDRIVIFSPSSIQFYVLLYNANKEYTGNTEGYVSYSDKLLEYRPKKIHWFMRILATKVPSGVIDDAQALGDNIVIKTVSMQNHYLMNRIVNNPLIESVSHQGYNIGNTSKENNASGFYGAYLRGFDTNLCNIQFSLDGVPVLSHDNDFVDSSTSQTVIISNTNWADLEDCEKNDQPLINFDQFVYMSKMLGLKIMSANTSSSWTDSQWATLFGTLRKYSMVQNMTWLISTAMSDSARTAILTKLYSFSKKQRIVYYFPTLTVANMNAVVESANSYAATYDGFEFIIWTPTKNEASSDVISCLEAGNAAITHDNVIMGACNIDSVQNYLDYAPYVGVYHSDYNPTSIYNRRVEDDIINKHPSIADTTYYKG